MTNWGVIVAVLLLVVWAFGTLNEWGGWVHALLTAGVFLLVWTMARNNKAGTAGRERQK